MLPEWFWPAVFTVTIGVVSWMARRTIAELGEIRRTMLRPADLELAVARMGAEVQDKIADAYYTRREAEQLERLFSRRD